MQEFNNNNVYSALDKLISISNGIVILFNDIKSRLTATNDPIIGLLTKLKI